MPKCYGVYYTDSNGRHREPKLEAIFTEEKDAKDYCNILAEKTFEDQVNNIRQGRKVFNGFFESLDKVAAEQDQFVRMNKYEEVLGGAYNVFNNAERMLCLQDNLPANVGRSGTYQYEVKPIFVHETIASALL